MTSPSPAVLDLKARILKRLAAFERHQNNPPWQVDRIGEIATDNNSTTLEALKEVRQELFTEFEGLPNKPESLVDGRLVRRNKNTSQRYTLIKDIIALVNFIKHGDQSKELRDCIRSNLESYTLSQTSDSNDTQLLGEECAPKCDLPQDNNVARPPKRTGSQQHSDKCCLLCDIVLSCDESAQHVQAVCASCKLLPKSVERLTDTIHQLQAEVNNLKNGVSCDPKEAKVNEDLTTEVQRLRDENASLVKIVDELVRQKPDAWESPGRRNTVRQGDVNKPSHAHSVIRTSNRFSPLDSTVGRDERHSSVESDLLETETQQIETYRKYQQARFYNTKSAGGTAIIGDSMIKHLKGNKMSRKKNVRCFTHRGARVEQLIPSALRIVQREKPSTVILHAGTNNNKDPAHLVTDKAYHLASSLQQCGVPNIAVSSVIIRTNENMEWTRQVNNGLSQMCSNNGWYYINNNNIGHRHIGPDGVHLNGYGTTQLAKNMIAFLSSNRPARVRDDTSFADAVRAPPQRPPGFRGRGTPRSLW
ncbi:hypothetical protein Bbelb_120720 [Branchiostoma belcheri]|nr:hypothetical protein Bbelb_120720 [Branchiostoma belcheri]